MTIVKVTALDAPEGSLDTDEQRFVDMIRKYGWFNTRIFAEDGRPGYNFTTGFDVTLGCPEIMAFSFPTDVAYSVLADVFNQVKEGLTLEHGKAYDNFANLPVVFQPVQRTHYADYLGWSRWFYAGDAFDCWQLVWSDREGRFPWHAEFEAKYKGLQPNLANDDGIWRAN